jgi:hypothetical protein
MEFIAGFWVKWSSSSQMKPHRRAGRYATKVSRIMRATPAAGDFHVFVIVGWPLLVRERQLALL